AGFDREEAVELLRFGLPLAGAGLLGFAVLNVDYVIVGRVLGPTALGLYLLAFNLSAWPVNMFSTAVHRVSVAGFSRMLGDPDALHRSLGRSMTLLMAVTLPAGALLALLAHPLISFVYGAKWTPAARALQFLAIAAVVRVAIGLVYDFLVAAGHPGSNLRLQAVWLLALGPGLMIGTKVDGIRGAGVASAVVAAAVVLPAALLALARAGASPWRVLAGLGRPLAGCALLVAVGTAVLAGVDGSFLELACAGSLAALAYAAVTFPLRHLARAGADPVDPAGGGDPGGPHHPAGPRHRRRRRRAVRRSLLRAVRRPPGLPEPTHPR
ncbi:MAG TPA: oligosaccharide flippase family protein, partial [Frankiaceae bacterium]|nr:oligosaccharide flippase family protein [Frankiaceae bacterium]